MKAKYRRKKNKLGFTTVEFLLASTFIAMLLVSIAVITSNIITIYQKGLSLKAVNSVGRGLIDELTTGINAAPSVDTKNLCENHIATSAEEGTYFVDLCRDNRANSFIFQNKIGTSSKSMAKVQLGGVFCTGNYSYIWNTYYTMNDDEAPNYRNAIRLTYLSTEKDLSTGKNKVVSLEPERMLRVEDPTYRVCSAVVGEYYASLLEDNETENDQVFNSSTGVIDITKLANGRLNPIKDPQTGFLNSFDLDLQLYEFTVFPISQDLVTQRTFMTGTFILATERGNINITRSGDYCDINAIAGEAEIGTAGSILDIGSEFNYCAINKFNFAARTAGM